MSGFDGAAKLTDDWERHWQATDVERAQRDVLSPFPSSNTTIYRPWVARMLERYEAPVVLESGCGPGQWLYFVVSQTKGRAIGLDIATEALDRVRRSALLEPYVESGRVELVAGDIRRAPLPDASIDVLFSFGVIEHMVDSESQKAVSDFARLLKPGGVALITTPNIFCIHTLTRPIAQRLGTWTVGFERSLPPSKLRRYAERAGLSIEQSGVFETGELFGATLNRKLPFLEQLSRRIERLQIGLGFIAYVVATKGPSRSANPRS